MVTATLKGQVLAQSNDTVMVWVQLWFRLCHHPESCLDPSPQIAKGTISKSTIHRRSVSMIVLMRLCRSSSFPPASISKEFFQDSDTHTTCSWKGVANYYTVRLPDGTITPDAAWYYPDTKVRQYPGSWKFVELSICNRRRPRISKDTWRFTRIK